MLIAILLYRYSKRWRNTLRSSQLFWPRPVSGARDFLNPLLYVLLLSIISMTDIITYFWGAVGLDFPYQWAEQHYYLSAKGSMIPKVLYGAMIQVINIIQIVWLVLVVIESGLSVFSSVGAMVSYFLGLVVSLLRLIGLFKKPAAKVTEKKNDTNNKDESTVKHTKSEVNANETTEQNEKFVQNREAQISAVRQRGVTTTNEDVAAQLRQAYKTVEEPDDHIPDDKQQASEEDDDTEEVLESTLTTSNVNDVDQHPSDDEENDSGTVSSGNSTLNAPSSPSKRSGIPQRSGIPRLRSPR